jgi:signal transduction histidine kinase
VAQFGPPILIGIYWKGASRAGAAAGLIAGFLIWAYTLLLPGFAQSGWIPASFIESGPLGIALLKPYQLFGLTGLDLYTHAVFWSMFANIGCLVGVSLITRQSALEQVQAALFTDIFSTPGGSESYIFGGTATVAELRALVARFLGEANAKRQFAAYAQSRNLPLHDHDHTDPQLINFAERLLAGAIGAASARVMVSSIVKGEALSIASVMQILDETSQVLEYSRRLEQKSRELETATAELRAANERLEELDRLKDDFVSTVSHELRTPLTSIRAFSEILRNNVEMAPAERQQFLDIVVRETERLTRLINEVLDLAKIESGRMEWRIAPNDLRELIGDALNSVSQLLKERRIDLHRELPGQPAIASVDRDRLIQVLINLLSNAAKFTEPGGRVDVRLTQVKDELAIQVRDSGPGIAPEHLDRVFDKFYQIGDPQGVRPKGTGLGLTICRRIIEHLQGHIWADSEPGKGATFTVVLPTYRVPAPTAAN